MINYQKYNYIFSGVVNSKNFNLAATPKLLKTNISAGLYRPTELNLAHVFILTSVTGKLPEICKCYTGPRRRQMYLLKSNLFGTVHATRFISRLVTIVFPSILDMKSIKNLKPIGSSTVETGFRMRYRFTANMPDCSELVTDELISSRRSIFLPLTIGLTFSKRDTKYSGVENLLQSMRLPLTFYRWWPFPAFDDSLYV